MGRERRKNRRRNAGGWGIRTGVWKRRSITWKTTNTSRDKTRGLPLLASKTGQTWFYVAHDVIKGEKGGKHCLGWRGGGGGNLGQRKSRGKIGLVKRYSDLGRFLRRGKKQVSLGTKGGKRRRGQKKRERGGK